MYGAAAEADGIRPGMIRNSWRIMRKPTLSVVIANYNHACHISEALNAVLSQSFAPTEVIVVDDGSTDDSIDIVEGFRKSHTIVKLLRNDKNRGVTFSNSRGLETASGDYVYFASSDDMVLPGFFEKSMELLSQYPRAGLCHTELKMLQGREYKFYLGRRQRFFSVDELTVIFKKRGYFTASGINSVIRREALLDSGGIIPQIGALWDVFAAMTVGARHGICYVPLPLVAIRTADDSYSGLAKRQGPVLRKILNEILCLLDTPAYKDFAEWVETTSVWPIFFPSMLYLLVRDTRRWRYLSLSLVRRALWQGVRITMGRIIPSAGKKLYFTMSNGYRKIASASA